MTVELPADVMESARISAEEVRLEIAVALFRVERLSLGRAAELAGLSVQTFLEILCFRRIGVHQGVEDALEDALCVFKSGNNNTDVLERNKKNVMFYVDLENELIVEKNASSNEMEDDGFNPEQALEHKHPMLLNQYPLCDNHSLFLLFPDDAFP